MFPFAPQKVGGPPYHVDFEAYDAALSTTGFMLEERQDKVAEGEEVRS